MSTVSHRIAGVMIASIVAAPLVGCNAGGDHPAPGAVVERWRASVPEETGAEVDGHPLGVAEFQTYWETRPERGADEVIDEVVGREIAVGKAIDEGLHRDDELQFVRKKAMVQELLRRSVEGEVGVEDLDEERVEKFEQQLRRRLGRPAGIRASHLLVMLPREDDESGESESQGTSESNGNEEGEAGEGGPDRDKLRGEAREWAERIREGLASDASLEDLFEARREFAGRVPEPLKVVVNARLSFPAPDARPFEGDLPADWMNVVPAFAEASDRLLAEGRAGELSQPVESKFGWHLVRAEERLEGRVPEPETLREVAVSRALRVARAKHYGEKLGEWRQGMSLAHYPETIAEAEGDRE